MNQLSDDAVMSRVKDGQVEMLAILFERYHVRIFNFFLRLSNDRPLSEDLAQELFFRILKYRHTYRGESAYSSWMYQIARNVHIDHLRRRHADTPLEELWEKEPSTPEATPAQRAESNQEAALLNRALARLPLRKREVLLLSRFQDLSYQEIAGLFECSVEAVKVLVHRAVKDLRKNFLELKGGLS